MQNAKRYRIRETSPEYQLEKFIYRHDISSDVRSGVVFSELEKFRRDDDRELDCRQSRCRTRLSPPSDASEF